MELTAQRARTIANEAIELNKILNENQDYLKLKLKLQIAVDNGFYFLAHSIQKKLREDGNE